LLLHRLFMERENLENEIERPTLGDHTRKSIVGAMYRVGTSFAMDAVYLSLMAAGAHYASESAGAIESAISGLSDFVQSLDPGKLARITGAVVGINFVDYKYNVTNKLDGLAKRVGNKVFGRPL